ncbi:hypothetical protein RF11_09670 [Thelohanellus kitauei]|uniref:Uncharacterized protein n=1 Tax=Thelohanellus kitauei TaxID=669202 RepID=A0A0C2IY73_THEKT|nr:hypothetical protein RF11_09670 [Thelohanellus kitauei]
MLIPSLPVFLIENEIKHSQLGVAINKTNYSDICLYIKVLEYESFGSAYSLYSIYHFTGSSKDKRVNSVVIRKMPKSRYILVWSKGMTRWRSRDIKVPNNLNEQEIQQEEHNLLFLHLENSVKFSFSLLVESKKTLWTQSVLRVHIYEWFTHARVDQTPKTLPKDFAAIMDLTYMSNQTVI